MKLIHKMNWRHAGTILTLNEFLEISIEKGRVKINDIFKLLLHSYHHENIDIVENNNLSIMSEVI